MPSKQQDWIERQLGLLPRHALVAGETPLHDLPRLSRKLGRRILVKRDDLTGLAFGGNKVRQAEFFIGEAVALGADTLIAGGSPAQSNHTRVLAAAARAAGLRPIVLVRPGSGAAGVDKRGNALVTRLLGAEVRVLEQLRDAPVGDRLAEVDFRRRIFESVADEERSRGRKPYVVLGSSTALGVMGYVAAAAEIARQADGRGLSIAEIFVTSLGATHAGLELGSRLLAASHDVVGFAYQPAERAAAERTVVQLIGAGAELLGAPSPKARPVRTDVDEAGSGYAMSTSRSRHALRLAAESDALVLDPTYTAKGFAGMVRWIEEGRVAEDGAVVFVHTGGLPGLFAQSMRELTRS